IRDRNVTGVQTCALPIYDPSISEIIAEVKGTAEDLFKAYKELLGVEPADKLVLYINQNKIILSADRALNTNNTTPIWHKNAFFNCFKGNLPQWKYLLRYEIAYVFEQKAQASKLGLLQAFLFSRPSAPLWSAGLPLYLSMPHLTPCDTRLLHNYWNVAKRAQQISLNMDLLLPILGRSQIH